MFESPFWRAGSGWEALQEGRKGLGRPHKEPGGVGRGERGWEAHVEGWEAHPEG